MVLFYQLIKTTSMYKESKDNVSVTLVLDKRGKNKEGLFPVRVQVIAKRVSKYYNTGKHISPEEWAKLPDKRTVDAVKMRNSLKSSFDLVIKSVEELTSKGEFSFDTLNIRLGRISAGTLNSALQTKINELYNEERIGSMMYYQSVAVSVEQFAGKSIPFEAITVDWLKRYESEMRKNDIRYATIGMRMRGIRAMMNRAKKDGLIKESQYPFGKDKYEIKTGESIKKALTIEQIAQVANYSDGNTTTERYRDLWLFIYLCNGLNTKDLVKLKFKNIVDGEICFIREKTKRTTKVVKEIRAVITPEMQAIIDKWGNKPIPDNYIFPLINHTTDPIQHEKEVRDLTKRINKRTKMIGETLNICKITTYSARHSFATVLKRSGANIAYISESLGHSDLKTTESYLASFEKDERLKNANLLTQYKTI